ncbi:histidine kinase [Membranicola marinus]|uniref:Histidine kinase n=1 Tax=Membranihabitans marinus TaxID=1227546 RepID=A0A953HUW7_9BACT|nr:histidine kinase [Membranihabitans marinus]MBY5958735.1 histidine kinase [Membranihabitans marinus]
MTKKIKGIPYLEYIFFLALILVVFIFYSFDRRNPGIRPYQVVSYLNLVWAALLVNYYLLPRFFYTKKYLRFLLYFCVVVAVVIFVEENILEKIYFPNTRGKKFLGVFYNLLGTLPTITILCGFKFAWDVLEKQSELENLKSTIQESELQFLKSQINPHFLFNNLNNVYSLSIENSPRTSEMILELSTFLRYMLYECKARYVPLKRELEQLQNFINLSEMQIEGRGEVELSIDDISSDYQIAPLILMVFVENAFKHSSSSQVDEISISIQIWMEAHNQFHFRCSNNYLSESNTKELSSGIGLKNVKKRLNLLYPQDHKLDIYQTDSHYEVNLILSLKKI